MQPGMKELAALELAASLLAFQSVEDGRGNTYILLASEFSQIKRDITDKTAFEAFENHVHLMDDIPEDGYDRALAVGTTIGQGVHDLLAARYPDKSFYVFVTAQRKGSLIVRFHQKWPGEPPYYDPDAESTVEETIRCWQ